MTGEKLNLKQCPFCDSSDIELTTHYSGPFKLGVKAFCKNCYAYGPAKIKPTDAIEVWNRRTRE